MVMQNLSLFRSALLVAVFGLGFGALMLSEDPQVATGQANSAAARSETETFVSPTVSFPARTDVENGRGAPTSAQVSGTHPDATALTREIRNLRTRIEALEAHAEGHLNEQEQIQDRRTLDERLWDDATAAEAERRATDEARTAAYAVFDAERIDKDWATRMHDRVELILARSPDVSGLVSEIECRSTLCRLEVMSSRLEAGDVLSELATAAMEVEETLLEGLVFATEDMVTVFLGRNEGAVRRLSDTSSWTLQAP
jgi:hypothetical protein